MAIYDRTITGTSGDDMLVGGDGNDYITSTGGHDEAIGGGGDDHLVFRGHGGDMSGGSGNDIFDLRKTGHGQYHVYAGAGDDVVIMDLANKATWGYQGYHVFAGYGDDSFRFVNVQGAESDVMARLDDFNPTRDRLSIDGTVIDLGNLPAGLRVVSYLGQQWLHINNDTSLNNSDPLRGDILIALNGARQMPDGEEVHFSPFPTNVDALPTVAFINENHVPYSLYSAREVSLNAIVTSGTSVTGTEGADYIYAYKDPGAPVGMDSTISGLGGDDVIEANHGHDTVNGDAGNDIIAGGLDNDYLRGGSGNDRLLGGSENDRLDGQSGSDILNGGTGSDEAIFSGARSSYTVTSANGVYTVVDNRTGSPDGTDTLTGIEFLRFADQVVDIGSNTTPGIVTGNSGDNTLTGGNGPDEIYGRAGHDILYGLSGNDKLYGEDGSDHLDGGTGDDAMVGAMGSDTYVVDSTGDTVTEAANAGLDTVRTTLSTFSLAALVNVEHLTYQGTASFTGIGNGLLNTLTGGSGNDLLNGGAAKDTLRGGAGSDTLVGGTGSDTLDGGTGADDFAFTAVDQSIPGTQDVIVGFVKGEDDIVVSAIDANAALAGDQAFVLDAGGVFTTGEIRQKVSGGSLIVEFNLDADTAIEMSVLLQGVTSPLAASDFVL